MHSETSAAEAGPLLDAYAALSRLLGERRDRVVKDVPLEVQSQVTNTFLRSIEMVDDGSLEEMYSHFAPYAPTSLELSSWPARCIIARIAREFDVPVTEIIHRGDGFQLVGDLDLPAQEKQRLQAMLDAAPPWLANMAVMTLHWLTIQVYNQLYPFRGSLLSTRLPTRRITIEQIHSCARVALGCLWLCLPYAPATAQLARDDLNYLIGRYSWDE